MEQKDIIEFQMLSAELEQVQGFLKQLLGQLETVNKLLEDITTFSELAPDGDALFPITNGIFVKGKISDTQELHVNVGQGVVVPRTIKQTTELIEEQRNSLVEQQVMAEQRQEELYRKLEVLEKKVSPE